MGRAQGQNKTTSMARRPRSRAQASISSTRFNQAQALTVLNDASARQAELARTTYALATHATEQAFSANVEEMQGFNCEIGLPVLNLSDADTAASLHEQAQFSLHTQLRVALLEGRRLREEDLRLLASDAASNANCSLLAEQATAGGAASYAAIVGKPEPRASVLSAGDWYDVLTEAARHANPHDYLQSALPRKLGWRISVERVSASTAL